MGDRGRRGARLDDRREDARPATGRGVLRAGRSPALGGAQSGCEGDRLLRRPEPVPTAEIVSGGMVPGNAALHERIVAELRAAFVKSASRPNLLIRSRPLKHVRQRSDPRALLGWAWDSFVCSSGRSGGTGDRRNAIPPVAGGRREGRGRATIRASTGS